MTIKINSVKFTASERLEKFVENKITKLNQYYDDIMGAEVFLRVEKPQNVENKITEIKVTVPGNTQLFAKKHANTFEEATDQAVEALRRQIKKHKEKLRGA